MSVSAALDSISACFSNRVVPWETQKEALVKLRELCKDAQYPLKANMIDLNIKNGLIKCVSDNRSALVSEACNTIVDLCRVIGQPFESTACDIFIGIIDKCASGVNVSGG